MVHGKGSVAAIDELQGAARVQNKGAYGIAEAHPNAQAMWNGDLQNLLKSDEMKKAVKGAISTSTNRVALDRNGIAVRHPFAVDSGTGGLTLKPLTDEQATASGAIPGTRPMPNLPFWDEVKKNLDGAIGIYQRAGNNPAAADAIGLKNSLLTHLDSMVPPYKAARQGAASFAKAKDAVEAGQNLVNDSTIGVDDAFKMRLKMKPAEREMTKIGIVDALKKKLGNQKDAADLTRSFLTAPNARSKIGMFLGPDNMNTLLRARGEEATMAVNKNAVQGNSKTVQRAVQSGLVGLGGGVLYGAAGDHSPYDIGAASLATGLTAALGRHASNKFTERMSVEIARKLVSGSRDAFASAQRTLANNPKLIATVRSLGVPLSLIGIHETVGN